MTARSPREDLEQRFTAALSRYIGYTTAAYDLNRIFSTLEVFQSSPSADHAEVISVLSGGQRSAEVGGDVVDPSDYLAEVINFARSMKILELVSSRSARLRRYAPTQLGRSLLGVRSLSEPAFENYFTTKVVLMADADALYPLLSSSTASLTANDLHLRYVRFHEALRARRLEWLEKAFPERILFSRVADEIAWLKTNNGSPRGYSIASLSKNSARHHATPRKGWLRELGLVDENFQLLAFGEDVRSSLEHKNDFFWLGPPEGTQAALRVPKDLRRQGPREDTFNFLAKAEAPSEVELQSLVADTAQIMMAAYNDAKLIYAPQASIIIPLQYVLYRCYSDGRDYGWEGILNRVFRTYRSSLKRMSAVKGPIGFYQYKPRD